MQTFYAYHIKIHIVLYFSRISTYAAEITFNLLHKVKVLRYLVEISLHRKAKQTINKFREVVKDSTKIITNNDITNPSYLADTVTSLDYGFMAPLTTEELINQTSNIFIAVS